MVFFISCGGMWQYGASTTGADSTADNEVYFRASGTEPFWSLEISANHMIFRTPEDSIITPSTKPVRDKYAETYEARTESAWLSISIVESTCTNDMSGQVSPYRVKVESKKNTDVSFRELNGCGEYIETAAIP
jgi:Predicted membrane protein